MTVLLFLFGLLLPSQTAIHFWPDFSFVGGIRIDYLSPTLYLTDILLLLVLARQVSFLKKILYSGSTPVFLLFLFFNIIFSFSPVLSLITAFRLAVYICFVLVLPPLSSETVKAFFWGLLSSLLWVTLLSLFQFINQGSLGGFWVLLGERPLNLFTSAVSSISLGSYGQFLRVYATLPHPNALAGFLIVSWFLVRSRYKKISENFNRFFWIITPLVVISLTLSFSRTAILAAVFLAGMYYFPKKVLSKVPRILIAIVLFLFVFNILPGNSASLPLRLQQIRLTFPQFIPPLLFGTGINTFIPTAEGNTLQPLHNAYLLSLSELGIIGLAVIVMFLLRLVRKFPGFPLEIKIAWLFIIATSFLDHYWITLHQNQFLVLILCYSTISAYVTDRNKYLFGRRLQK